MVAEVPERFARQQAVVDLTGLRVLAGGAGAEGFPIVRGSDIPLLVEVVGDQAEVYLGLAP